MFRFFYSYGNVIILDTVTYNYNVININFFFVIAWSSLKLLHEIGWKKIV